MASQGRILGSAPSHIAASVIAARVDEIDLGIAQGAPSSEDKVANKLRWRHLVLRGFKLRDEVEAFRNLLEHPDLGDAAIKASRGSWKGKSHWHLERSAAFYLLLVLGCPGAGRELGSEDSHHLHEMQAEANDNKDLECIRQLAANKIQWGDFMRLGGLNSSVVKALLEEIIRRADGVFGTPALLSSTEDVYAEVRNQAKGVIIDEAGAISRADFASVHGNTLLPLLCAGDEKQLSPTRLTLETKDDADNFLNRHASDGKISGLEWLKLQGFPTFRLRIQLRMARGMFAIVQKHIYKDVALAYAASCAIDRPQQQPGRKLEELLSEKYNIKPPQEKNLEAAFLHCDNSYCIVDNVTMSKKNPRQVQAALDFLRQLVQEKGVDPAVVAIITPYAWNVEYIVSQLKRQENTCLQGLQPPRTVDGFQGLEADIVVFILVGTKQTGPGFMTDEQRLNVALSRQRCGLLLVGDINIAGQVEEVENKYSGKGKNMGPAKRAREKKFREEKDDRALRIALHTGEEVFMKPGVLRGVLKDFVASGRVAKYEAHHWALWPLAEEETTE